MRQAIEEGFILDVLKNYTTYKAYYKMIKMAAEDPQAGVTAGTDLTGGGTTGTVTLNLDTTRVPTLAAANSFTGSPNAFTGNVGIGTQTPVAKLEVNGSVQADGNVTIATLGSGLIFPDGTKQTTAGGSITGVTAGTDLTGGGTSGTVTLSLDTTKVPTLAGANSFTGSPNAFTGNVGIGTLTPSSKLDVAGDINFSGNVLYQGVRCCKYPVACLVTASLWDPER
jgi:hypothetical protein